MYDNKEKERQHYLNMMDSVINLTLILGVIYLASNGYDGWGWLIFLLMIKN